MDIHFSASKRVVLLLVDDINCLWISEVNIDILQRQQAYVHPRDQMFDYLGTVLSYEFFLPFFLSYY